MSSLRDRARAVPPAEWLLLGGLVLLAALIRYACRSYYTSDLVVFGQWYDQLQEHGFHRNVGNYNAPFLYLLEIASWLPGATLMKIKLVLVAFDVLLIFFVFRTVALFRPGKPAIAAALIAAFTPTVVVNASMYGQCDSIWAAFCLGGLYYLIRDKPWAAMALFATAYAFKPQAIFLFPVILLAVLAGKAKARTLLALPLTYLLLDLPAVLLGRNPVELLTLYADQLDEPSALRRGAPNVYQYLRVTVGLDVLKNLGYLFAAALVLGVCYVLIASRARLDATRLVTAGAFFAIAIPWLLPGMHERYFYLADVLTLVLAFYRPRLWFLPLVVQAASFLAYLPFLFRTGPVGPLLDPRLLATLMLAALVLTGYSLLSDVTQRTTVGEVAEPTSVRSREAVRKDRRDGLDPFEEPPETKPEKKVGHTTVGSPT
ncbi:hypothetical protein [Cryptosporangium sp. NPDC051539]|uniref:hypothetical protein n=1 Tax=Cryptosporangium sp. NPDC051539 TaxID=3363962 RepID=UPI0037B0C4E3